jgi:hypothetical protein
MLGDSNKRVMPMIVYSEVARCGPGEQMNKRNVIAGAMCMAFVVSGGGRAIAQDGTLQPGTSDEDIRLFRKDLRSLKKQIIAANMDLTETEAQQFWPTYDRYTAELTAITDRKYALLKEYATNYDAITGDQAETYVKGRGDVEESITKLRLKYFQLFRKVLSSKSTARFFQIDWRLGLIMDLQLMSQTPLIEPH